MHMAIQLLGLALCAPASLGQGSLEPIKVAFEGPPYLPLGSVVTERAYYESGIYFRGLGYGFTRVAGGRSTRPENGTAYLAAALGDSLVFSFTNGSLFSLTAVDLAEYSTVVPDAVTVHFVGYRADGSVVMADLATDGIIDGTGPIADFQTFTFGPEFANLSRVEIPTYGWSLDNLHLTRNIPEPSSPALFLTGVLFCFVRFLSRRVSLSGNCES